MPAGLSPTRTPEDESAEFFGIGETERAYPSYRSTNAFRRRGDPLRHAKADHGLNRPKRFEALFAAHGEAVAKILSRYSRDRAEAEDLLQDVFLDVWRSLDRLSADRDPLPWLRTIAVNRAIDRLRRDARGPAPASSIALETVAAPPTSSRLDFEDELRLLPAGERAAAILYYADGRDTAEIAALLEVPAGTVKTWLFRARTRLKTRLVPSDAVSGKGTAP